MKRNNVIDIMKGLCILAVVNQHALTEKFLDTIATVKVFNVTTSFNMMVFMLVAGYFSYGRVGNGQWALSKSIRWIIPILISLPLYWYFRYNDQPFGTWMANSIVEGFTGMILWFLWCLSLCYPVGYILEKIKLPFTIKIVALILFLAFIPVYPLGIKYLKWYGLFYFIGYGLKYYLTKYQSRWIRMSVYSSVVIFPILIYFTNGMTSYNNIDYGYLGFTIIDKAVFNGYGYLVGIMFGVAVFGVMFTYSMAKLLDKMKYLNKVLAYIGNASAGILLIHYFFIQTVNIYPLSAFAAVVISLILYELLHRVKILDALLFGNPYLVNGLVKRYGAVSSV